eukprot:18703_1
MASWLSNSGGNNAEQQYYEKLFRFFDTSNYGFVQGNQVFGLFLSSGLNKTALGDIWDEATQKQTGGLNLNKFINAIKLISLAQKGIKPTLQNVNLPQNQPITMAKMQYPPQIELPSATPANKPDDAFASLTSGFGFKTASSTQPNDNKGDAKPVGPTWDASMGDSNPQTMDGGTGTNTVLSDNSTFDSPKFGAIPNTNNNAMTSSLGSLNDNNVINEYAPSRPSARHNTTLTVINNDLLPSSHTPQALQDSHVAPPSLNRRISTKILYQEERMREQLRQAEEREKLAKKQANTQRIENERLERENEQLKYEINEARKGQSDALRQSTEAINSVSPLRLENDKLKAAINQWKDLIQTKDEELEQLEAEVDQLRLENEKLENVLTADKSKSEEIQFKLDRSDALLKELRNKHNHYEMTINELKQNVITLEDYKRN